VPSRRFGGSTPLMPSMEQRQRYEACANSGSEGSFNISL
jgi:hypothetical protein